MRKVSFLFSKFSNVFRFVTSYISTQLRTYDREGVRFFEVGGDDGDGLFRRGTAAREQVVK